MRPFPFPLFAALRVCLWLALCGGVVPATARAYELEGPRWPSDKPVVMYLQLANAKPSLVDGAPSWDAVAGSALSIWNQCLGSGVRFTVGTTLASQTRGDGKNTVFFSSSAFGYDFGDDTLAVTVWSTNADNSLFTEADVVVNSAYPFNSYRGTFQYYNGYDLRRVLLHEFGHVLGLDHVDQSVVAVMTPVISDIDTIEADDIAGVEAIYGAVGGQRPVITSSPSAAAYSNHDFQYQITASNGPISYYASGLPSGFYINTSTGVIFGTPAYLNAASTSNVTVTATNAAGSSSAPLVLTLYPPPTITSPRQTGGQVGQPFTYQITASVTPVSFAAFNGDGGPLPAGLSVNTTTGLISGVLPGGLQFFRVQATNGAGTGSETITVDTTYVPPAITGIRNVNPLVADHYASTGAACLFSIDVTGRFNYFTASGLPPGMYINSLGGIMGTPTTPGTYAVTVTVLGAYSTSTYAWTLEVGGQPIALTSGTITGQAGVPLTYQITGSPMPTGFQFAYTYGHTGLNLDPATGVISGTMLSPTTGTVTVFLSNGADGAMVDIPVNIASNYVSSFFIGENVIDNVYLLMFGEGTPFGLYVYLSDRHYIYHFDMGYEYVFDAGDGFNGVYLYDFKSSGFFYTSPNFGFPYMYDFTLNSVVYYYPNPTMAWRYNTNGVRYFYVFGTGQIISK